MKKMHNPLSYILVVSSLWLSCMVQDGVLAATPRHLAFAQATSTRAIKQAVVTAEEQRYLSPENQSKVALIINSLKRLYYTEVQEDTIVENMLSGLLAKMDPHSSYIPKNEMNDFESEISGQFGGIGIEISYDNGSIVVVTPLDDSPAFRAGIKSGDRIIQIDEVLAHDISTKKAVELMRGKPGSKVKLVIIPKKGAAPVVKELVREMIKVKSVKYRMLEPGYGYIRVTFFQQHTGKELREAIVALQQQARDEALKAAVSAQAAQTKADAEKKLEAKRQIEGISLDPEAADITNAADDDATDTEAANNSSREPGNPSRMQQIIDNVINKIKTVTGRNPASTTETNASGESMPPADMTNPAVHGAPDGQPVPTGQEQQQQQLDSNQQPQVAVLSDRQSGLKGVVLDLRNNPGGLLDASIQVADAFLDAAKLAQDKLIVYTDGRDIDSKFVAHATGGDLLQDLPLVVLINEGSASAAEIVAGALHDHHRAVVVGRRSFGKGSVQSLIPISDGSGFKITVALYYTPGGKSIQAQGIQPDVELEELKLTPKMLDKEGISITEANLIDHIETQPKQPQQPKAGCQNNCSEQKAASEEERLVYKDYFLHQALQILKAGAVFHQYYCQQATLCPAANSAATQPASQKNSAGTAVPVSAVDQNSGKGIFDEFFWLDPARTASSLSLQPLAGQDLESAEHGWMSDPLAQFLKDN